MLDYEAQLLYEYLAHRHQLLLPEYKSCTLEYLKKVEKGEKKVLKLSEAKESWCKVGGKQRETWYQWGRIRKYFGYYGRTWK